MFNWQILEEIINKAQRVALITHPTPDQDAVGSTGAMLGYLLGADKDCLAFSVDPVTGHLMDIPWAYEFTSDLSKLGQFKPDLILILDMSDVKRTGLAEQIVKWQDEQIPVAVIDHHENPDLRTPYLFIDPEASSTSELVADYFKAINYQPNQAIAQALLSGLLADTENFSNAATTAKTFKTSAWLLRLGADFKRATNAYRARDLPNLKLLGLGLARISYNQKYDLVVTVIKKEDQERLGLQEAATLGLSDFLKSLGNQKVVLVLKQKEDNLITGSLRSTSSKREVLPLAQALGGGGHKLAAGFSVKGNLKRVKGQWRIE